MDAPWIWNTNCWQEDKIMIDLRYCCGKQLLIQSSNKISTLREGWKWKAWKAHTRKRRVSTPLEAIRTSIVAAWIQNAFRNSLAEELWHRSSDAFGANLEAAKPGFTAESSLLHMKNGLPARGVCGLLSIHGPVKAVICRWSGSMCMVQCRVACRRDRW